MRAVATADFGNGVSAELPFDDYLFINADLTIHLWRAPRGEWIGLDAQTLLQAVVSVSRRAFFTTSRARSAAPFRRWSYSLVETPAIGRR